MFVINARTEIKQSKSWKDVDGFVKNKNNRNKKIPSPSFDEEWPPNSGTNAFALILNDGRRTVATVTSTDPKRWLGLNNTFFEKHDVAAWCEI